METIDVRNWKGLGARRATSDQKTEAIVRSVIEAVRSGGDAAVRAYAAKFDRSSPESLEVPLSIAEVELEKLRRENPSLVKALECARGSIERFAQLQKAQCSDFEVELSPGLFTGQRVLPVARAAVYVPSGRFPLVSTVLMGVVPARVAGVGEVVLASAPLEDGLPDRRILAAAALAGVDRIFAVGGSQAIAALALGTETVPRADVIVGPGNRFVAAAKKLLYGEVGIDFVAGPTDVLIIADEAADPELVAADLLAQAEHDVDARARALLPSSSFARKVEAAVDRRLSFLDTAETAGASLEAGGLLLVYEDREEAVRAADAIAPEHLELHLSDAEDWVPLLGNYGSLFIGAQSAEALGDYSAGINHTLPTSGSARFTGGLSVRHFLRFLTTLRGNTAEALETAVSIAQAEGLTGHERSAAARLVQS